MLPDSGEIFMTFARFFLGFLKYLHTILGSFFQFRLFLASYKFTDVAVAN